MALLQDDFWLTLCQDDHTGFTVDSDNTASRSARLASCFLELEKVNQDLENKLHDDFNNILSSMASLSLSPVPQSSSPFNPPTRSISSIQSPPFTVAAYFWLLENIANPYPSSSVKESLAQQHNCLLPAVNTWFVNARRRVGWTAVCRDHFNNCRADTLDAAYRALVNEDPNRPLPPNVIHAFVSVRTTVADLYSSIVAKSAFTGDLDAVAGDTTDKGTILVGKRKRCELEETTESPGTSVVETQNEKLVAHSSCIHTDSSCSSSPVPPLIESFTDDSDDEDEVSPPILAGRKRGLSDLNSAHTTISTLNIKRRKYMSPISCPSVETGPLALEESSKTFSGSQNPCPAPTRQNIPTLHKRRLLHPDTTGRPIYPQESTVEPPLLLSKSESERSIDEWFNNNFNNLFSLPPPAAVIEPDLSAQCEVELFSNYDIPPEVPQTRPFKSPSPSTRNQVSTPMDLLTLDNALRSLESGEFTAPSGLMDPVFTLFATDSLPQYPSPEHIDWTALLNWKTPNPSLNSLLGHAHFDSLSLPGTGLPTLWYSHFHF